MAPDPKDTASDSDDSSSRSSSPGSSADAQPVVKEDSKENGESGSSSNSGSGQEGSNSSDESSSDDDPSNEEHEDNGTAQKQQSTNRPLNQAARPAQAFKPPSGFKSPKNQSPPSSEASSIVSKTSSKQVFHITAPASLPLSKVKQVSLANVLQGEPVLNHEGVSYGIPPENISQGDLGDKKLLLYDPKSQTYYSSPLCNIPSYHVQEMISSPQTIKDSSDAMSISQETAKPAKKQPKNLKMRFRPVGSGNGPAETIGTSSEESEGEKTMSKAPKRTGKEKEERKRKHHHTEGDGSQSNARKKSKKHSSPDGASAPPSSQMEVDGEPGHKKSKKSNKNRDEKKRKKSKEAA